MSGQTIMAGQGVAIIPARGGSKGVPRKNIRMLAGKPLLAHAIAAAGQARHIGSVVVSTDDAQIAEVAEAFGARVVRRPAAFAGDKAPSELAVLHVLETLKGEGSLPLLTAFIQATSPLTLPEDIDGTIETLLSADADSCFAATPFVHFLWQKNSAGDAVGINHDWSARLMRQDVAPQYLETGAVYVMRSEGFLKARYRFFGKIAMHETPPERCLEIDTLDDFDRAATALASRDRVRRAAGLPAVPAVVIFDFDGVFTDNGVWVKEDGTETVRCDRGDGFGLDMLRAAGVPLLILSKEKNPVVAARCRKLRLEHLSGIDDKLTVLRSWATQRSLSLEAAVYVGNDLNDVPCMQAVGCAICPADGHESAKRVADIVLEAPGGRGAVREVCDMVLARRDLTLSGWQASK
jgi:YrbI family 3-deoxy-D-manno-octulosonate 8-phosphate phosphatase